MVSPIEKDSEMIPFTSVYILFFLQISSYYGERYVIYFSFIVFWRFDGWLGHEKQTASLICPAELTKILCGLISPTFLLIREKSFAVVTKV